MLVLLSLTLATQVIAQAVNWTGVTSSDWFAGANWSTGTVPGATSDVIIGGTGFTGANQPRIDGSTAVTIKSLTLKNTSVGGTKIGSLFISNDQNVIINGALNIESGATLENNGTNLSIGGNWTNDGIYVESTNYKNNGARGRYFPSVTLSGSGVTFGGSTASAISHLLIAGSVSLASDLNIRPLELPSSVHKNIISTSDLKVSGTLNPSAYKVIWLPDSKNYPGDFVVEPSGTIKVMATTYAGNYGKQPTTMYTTSTVDYAATSGTQTVLAREYGILKTSGGGIKELEGNTTVSSIDAATQLIVEAGILDLKTFTLNRTSSGTSVAGGTLTVANGATLRIGGTNTFPTGYQTRNLGSTSTVEYYGSNQVVSNELYGNLHLTSLAASSKTMPSTAMTVAGNFIGSGFASFTALANINVIGNVRLIGSSSFNGGSNLTHTVAGNWRNNADFTGNTSTVVMTGTSKTINRTVGISGAQKNEFYNLSITGSDVKIDTLATPTLAINGNLSTSGAGSFTQSTGSLTMAGAGSISGTGITLNNFIANGTTTTTTSFTVNGDFTTNSSRSFVATGGTVTMGGASKSINNNGTTTFFGLRIFNAVNQTNTSSSFNINSDLSGNGLTATGGTVTFGGATATFAGTHNLHNVSVTGSDRRMVANANMGIAGALGVTGTLNVTANIPNTITYNGGAAQTILPGVYHNLVLSGAGAKSTAGNVTANGNLTINIGASFSAGSHATTINGNWTNSGTFTAGTSNVTFAGAANSTITGATTFNTLTVNKTVVSNYISLEHAVTTGTLSLTSGSLRTGSSKVTVTSDRSGTGWVVGTMTRVVSAGYVAGTPYVFNGPEAKITLGTVSGITEVTMTTGIGAATNIQGGAAINRLYQITIPAGGTYTNATLQLQYEESELNGNSESRLGLFNATASSGPWTSIGRSGGSELNNFAFANNQNDVSGYWTLAEIPNVHQWVGGTSIAWETGSNWRVLKSDGSVIQPGTESIPPTPSDIAELGGVIPNNQPTISSAVSIKGLQFKDASGITLTLASGSLSMVGNLAATGTGNVQHTVATNVSNVSVGGNLILNEGSNSINLVKTTGGEIAVAGAVNQSAGSITLGNGILKIGSDYNYTGGAFAPGTGTVEYNGAGSQCIAPLNYHSLIVSKATGVATLTAPSALSFSGNLTHSGAGALVLQAADLTVTGNVNQSAGSIDAGSSNLKISGNWIRSGGVFTPNTSTVIFIGGAATTVAATTFNNLTVNKGAALTTAGSTVINGGLTVQAGTFVIEEAHTVNRSAVGGTFTVADNAILELRGASNFPANFNTSNLAASSTVHYSGSVAQFVAPVTYGKLTFSNGGASAKTLTGAAKAVGDILVNSGATFNVNSQTLTINGNFTSLGSFVPGAYAAPTPPNGTLILAPTGGVTKTIAGANLSVNNMIVSVGAMYALGSDFTINGNIDITGDGNVFLKPNEPNPANRDFNYAGVPLNGYLVAPGINVSVAGDFRNSGMLFSDGLAKFLGNRQQTIQLLAPIIPYNNNAPKVEFAGTVSPILSSSRSPEFADVTISNTGSEGVKTSVGWGVAGKFIVMPNATFDGGSNTHKFYSAVVNHGTIKSAGLIDFTTPYPFAAAPPAHPFVFGQFESTGTLKFGGSGQVLLAGSIPPVLNNLVISNTKGLTTTTLDAGYVLSFTDWNINGNLVIESAGLLNAIPQTASTLGTNFFIKGNLTNNGSVVSLIPGAATPTPFGIGANFTFNGTDSEISGTGTTMLGNLISAVNSKLTINKNINVYGNLAHNGNSFNAGESYITFIGAGPSVISAPANMAATPEVPLELSNLTVAKDAQTLPVNVKTDLSKVLNVTVQRGLLDLETSTVTAYPDIVADGTTTVVTSTVAAAAGATIKVGGTNTLPDADVTSLEATSTVEYYGTDQQIRSVQYGNLTLKNSGAATFDPETALIAGDFVVAGGVGQSVITPETVNFNGDRAQTIAAINYQNLTLSTNNVKTFATGTVGVSGSLTTAGTATANARANSTTVNYNGITQSVLPINYHGLALSNAGTKTFSGTTGVAGNFTTAGTATADLTSNVTTLDFNGTGAQTMAGVNYNNILVSAGGTKTLTGDANVAQELKLTNGTISTGSNRFILGTSATLVESAAGYVTGFVETQREMTTAMESFGGLGISITPMVAPGTVGVVRETGRAITAAGNESVLRNYSFAASGTNTDLNATVSFSYFAHETNGLDVSALQLATSSDGTSWRMHGTSVSSPERSLVGANTVHSLTRMTLGSSVTPLPVELKYLRAEKQGQHAVITWETAREENSRGFEVEVSLDGVNYRALGFVGSGAPALRAGSLYAYTDREKGKEGARYYRLKQLDLDGKHTYYGPRALTFERESALNAIAYPNPFQATMEVSFYAENSGTAKGILYTVAGRVVHEDAIPVVSGVNNHKLNASLQNLNAGMYLFIIELDGKKQSIKVIRE
ncbi:hypothetical protein ABID22_000184 [Pontibacter aydingkolensis]|uniref:T9SS type A sorting domain-containing protein n=1 Tax=Pontibacter aydingkolensis TaxID=1911536 RepID=A0ABS7CQM3_9BACT|nr:T9SS type A sorting domain-containing protein [Pontibacter aydingkolensis]MBW7466149.1 T9SS type A sorting domain-containing protein [Pontibacter aydingkolensis]